MSTSGTITYDLNGQTMTFEPNRGLLDRRWFKVLMACLAGTLLALVVPTLAHASILDDFFNTINDAFCTAAESALNAVAYVTTHMAQSDMLTADFVNLFAGSSSDGMYQFAYSIARNTIFPVSCVFLSLSILMQLLKIAQRVDGNATMPTLKETLILAVTVVVATYVLGHSFGIMRDIYDLVTSWTKQVAFGTTSVQFSLDRDAILASTSFGTMVMFWLYAIILMLVALVVYALTEITLVGRAIQIYLYATFSPLMLSLIGVDELRPWWMGFLKGFIACCLSGFIVAFALKAFPYVMTSLMANASSATTSDGTVLVTIADVGIDNMFGWFVAAIVSLGSLGIVARKSGTWAQSILGN